MTELKKWPRYDPSRDMYLCESCWNAGTWKHHCSLGMCEWPPCTTGLMPPRKAKFTGEGQTKISVDSIEIGPKS